MKKFMKNICSFVSNKYVLTIFCFCWVAIGVFFIIFKTPFSWHSQIDWGVITGFASWLLVLGIIGAIWQINETRKSTNAQIAMDLFKELRSDRALEILRFIYSLKPDDDFSNLCNTDLHSIEYILDRFEVLGSLVERTTLDKKISIDAYAGASALRSWYILHNYIWGLSLRNGPYKVNYESYTRHSLEYFKERGFPVKLDIAGNPTNIIDLILNSKFKPRTLNEINQQMKTFVEILLKLPPNSKNPEYTKNKLKDTRADLRKKDYENYRHQKVKTIKLAEKSLDFDNLQSKLNNKGETKKENDEFLLILWCVHGKLEMRLYRTKSLYKIPPILDAC